MIVTPKEIIVLKKMKREIPKFKVHHILYNIFLLFFLYRGIFYIFYIPSVTRFFPCITIVFF